METEDSPGLGNTVQTQTSQCADPGSGGQKNDMENSKATSPPQSSYETDLQRIEDLMKKYQMRDEPDQLTGKREVNANEFEKISNSLHNVKDEENEEKSEQTEEEEILEENCDMRSDEGDDLKSTELCNVDEADMQNTVHTLECQSPDPSENLEPEDLDTRTDGNAHLATEDINANTKKDPLITTDFYSTTDYQENYNLWQNDFHEDSETFQIFQLPTTLDHGSESSGRFSQKTDISPDSASIADEVTTCINGDNIQIDIEPKGTDESRQKLTSVKLTSPMIQQQVELYTRWYQNVKEILVPLTCSCSSYNVFSMARKLTVLSLVLIALLYSMMVPSPAESYEYKITSGLGPQALYYYKQFAGKGGYHQVNNLLFDTGQVYPPPRKEIPSLEPSRYRKRKRRRRKVPSHVRHALPLVMRQQVEAFENGWKPKTLISRKKIDDGDRFHNNQRNVDLGVGIYREGIVDGAGNQHNGAELLYQQERLGELEVVNQDDKKLQGNHYNADDFASSEFYKILPGDGELDIFLKKGECGEFCMFRINFRKQPNGLIESRVVMWSQWKGEYKLKGLDKDSSYWVEICRYGNKGSTNNCNETEVETY